MISDLSWITPSLVHAGARALQTAKGGVVAFQFTVSSGKEVIATFEFRDAPVDAFVCRLWPHTEWPLSESNLNSAIPRLNAINSATWMIKAYIEDRGEMFTTCFQYALPMDDSISVEYLRAVASRFVSMSLPYL